MNLGRSRLGLRALAAAGVVAVLVGSAVMFLRGPSSSASTAMGLTTGFTDTEWVSGLHRPYQMEFAPDGRLFVTQQGGGLRVIKDGRLLPDPFLRVAVNTHGDRGLIGVAFDPAFAVNHFVYVYYTAPTPHAHNRVSRFTSAGDVAVPGSEKIIIELPDLGPSTIHNGGSIHFGADGKLYIATGENVQGPVAQSMTSLLGKMLRLNPDGSIPSDNPFFSTATGAFRSIWALGLRNPYTFGIQPGTGRILINDVGADAWEEINDGIRGANYGWPATEGPTTDPRFTGPLFAYGHGTTATAESTDATGTTGFTGTTGCAIAGGTFYNPVVPQFPTSYIDKYFFADACSGWIRVLDPAAGTAEPFLSAGVGLIDVKTGPDGSLYYLSRLNDVNNPGFVHKVTFSGKPAIASPPAGIIVSPGEPAPFTVVASGSPPLSYQWQRDGKNIDGANESSFTLQAPTLADNGSQFSVKVSSSRGSTTSAAATLIVTDNRAPVGTIETPSTGSHYDAGDTITFSGAADDPEDGTLPANAFAWEIAFHHNTHTHLGPAIGPGPSGDGRSGSFVVPTTGETSTDVFYRVHLTVTDSAGRSSESFVDVLPNTTTLSFDTLTGGATSASPAGLQINLDGQPHLTPYSEDSVVGIKRTLEVVSPQVLGTTTYAFSSWSDGGPSRHEITTPASPSAYTASFAADTVKPVVSVSAPVASAVLSGTTSLAATASDNVGVTVVKWYVDNDEVASDSVGPAWSESWATTSLADGPHQIFAKARDASGNWGTSSVLTFTVDNP